MKNLTKTQANAILSLLAEAYELDYINEQGDLELFGDIYPASEIKDLENICKKLTSWTK